MPEDWERVAAAVKRRRTDLGMSQRSAAAAADISPTTWGQLEKHAQRVDPLTRTAMCRALGWTTDSIDRVLRGEDPEVDPDATPPRSVEQRLTDLEQRLRSLERLVLESIHEDDADGQPDA